MKLELVIENFDIIRVAADLIKFSQNGLTYLQWLADYLKRTTIWPFLFSSPLWHMKESQNQKIRISSSRSIRIALTQFAKTSYHRYYIRSQPCSILDPKFPSLVCKVFLKLRLVKQKNFSRTPKTLKNNKN